MLLDLRMDLPAVQVQVLSRPQETRHGAGWVWWWQGRPRWFGAMIQAKKRAPNSTYDFSYRPRPRRDGKQRPRQIDTLISSSEGIGLPALYAPYRPAARVSARARSACPLLPYWPGTDGLSVLDARVARWLADSQQPGGVPARDVEDLSRPLSCLVSCTELCPGRAVAQHGVLWRRLGFEEQPQEDDLAWRAALTTHLAARADRRQFFQQTGLPDQVNEHTGHSDARVASAVREAPPLYVLEPGRLRDPAPADPDGVERGEVPPPGVGYVVVATDPSPPQG